MAGEEEGREEEEKNGGGGLLLAYFSGGTQHIHENGSCTLLVCCPSTLSWQKLPIMFYHRTQRHPLTGGKRAIHSALLCSWRRSSRAAEGRNCCRASERRNEERLYNSVGRISHNITLPTT